MRHERRHRVMTLPSSNDACDCIALVLSRTRAPSPSVEDSCPFLFPSLHSPFPLTPMACVASDSGPHSLLLVLGTRSLVCSCHCEVAHPPLQLTSTLTDQGPAPQEESSSTMPTRYTSPNHPSRPPHTRAIGKVALSHDICARKQEIRSSFLERI